MMLIKVLTHLLLRRVNWSRRLYSFSLLRWLFELVCREEAVFVDRGWSCDVVSRSEGVGAVVYASTAVAIAVL